MGGKVAVVIMISGRKSVHIVEITLTETAYMQDKYEIWQEEGEMNLSSLVPLRSFSLAIDQINISARMIAPMDDNPILITMHVEIPVIHKYIIPFHEDDHLFIINLSLRISKNSSFISSESTTTNR